MMFTIREKLEKLAIFGPGGHNFGMRENDPNSFAWVLSSWSFVGLFLRLSSPLVFKFDGVFLFPHSTLA